ncbi:unnamed protein product [Leptidea sinapis]|uniref:Uncharacterized protein n=1 Tax=Leptidea sinapis TaxID=189913 RepID=A0A5E4Q8A1_9NEOP|nr:unnamed protein product [Leptidea sinapis]
MSRRLTKRYLTDADEYKCPLSPETQAIAEEELRETENSRSQALAALRSWLEQNPKFLAIRTSCCVIFVPKNSAYLWLKKQ